VGAAFKQRVHVQLLAVTLHIAAQPSNTFDPRVAFGAGIDGHEAGEIAAKLTPANIQQMRSAGLKPLTYRLRTELAGQAWHWNTRGTWSDTVLQQGYWTGDSGNATASKVSYGYRLPRRGNSIDQANNDGYSRIDDGDLATFWKSNPYLGSRPQWIAIDLGRSTSINTVRIDWAQPYATRWHAEYSTEHFPNLNSTAGWQPFTQGEARSMRWLRIALEQSSGTGPLTADARDRTGFAVRELFAGLTDAAGRFTDLIHHAPSRIRQTAIYVSSTDPWHRAIDRDPKIEQPGMDFTFQSGLSNGLPVLMAAPVLYDTPENTAALMAYLRARHYPVTDVELGEEPEEQFVSPEDYAELSRNVIAAIRSKGLSPRFGGPSLILLHSKLATDAEWMARLYSDHQAAGSLDALGFFSFEWYPFDDICASASKQLAHSAELLFGALAKIAAAGIPRTLPWYMTEYGFSAYGTQAEVDLPGAILNAEAVALFLTAGGSRAYLYGYEPGELLHDRACTWGNNMILFNGKPTSTYWAARLLAESWADPNGGLHQSFPVTTDNPLVSAYALKRPSGEMALLLFNKSPTKAESVTLSYEGPHEVTQFSSTQYRWRAAGEQSRIELSSPPVHTHQNSSQLVLPPYSITVAPGPAR
jgi:hypothetical protein